MPDDVVLQKQFSVFPQYSEVIFVPPVPAADRLVSLNGEKKPLCSCPHTSSVYTIPKHCDIHVGVTCKSDKIRK